MAWGGRGLGTTDDCGWTRAATRAKSSCMRPVTRVPSWQLGLGPVFLFAPNSPCVPVGYRYAWKQL